LTSHGRKKARGQFISAVGWAQDSGAKIILLAAGTKRLFGSDGQRIKELFPDLIFTIGDNGTMVILLQETLQALQHSNLKPGKARIGVLGPYGFLGETMVKALTDRGFEVIGAGPNNGGLTKVASKYDITVCQSFSEIGKVDAVIACTHSDKIRLNTSSIDMIRPHQKKLLVIDVAEPSNLTKAEFVNCQDRVIRLDSGNAYSPNLKYVLGAISYRMFRLTRGVTFGCFAETLSLAAAISCGDGDIAGINWFDVNEENMRIISCLFEQNGFTAPNPRNFGREIRSFCLHR
jgi:predicted amino acid dehydrogenase